MKVEQAPFSVGFFRSKLMSDLLRNFSQRPFSLGKALKCLACVASSSTPRQAQGNANLSKYVRRSYALAAAKERPMPSAWTHRRVNRGNSRIPLWSRGALICLRQMPCFTFANSSISTLKLRIRPVLPLFTSIGKTCPCLASR